MRGGIDREADETVTEATMFGQRRGGRERLTAVGAPNRLSTVGVHALVATQVRELCVRLETDVATKRLHAAVDVLVLLETTRRGERLAAAGTLMRTCGMDSCCGCGVSVQTARGPICTAVASVRIRWKETTRTAVIIQRWRTVCLLQNNILLSSCITSVWQQHY